MCHANEEGGPENGAENAGGELLKFGGELRRRFPSERAGASLQDVFKCPTRHHGIEAEDEEGTQHTVVADEAPLGAGSHHLEGTRRVAVRVSANEKFGNHNRYAQQQDADKVDEDECSTAVCPDHIGESPDVA